MPSWVSIFADIIGILGGFFAFFAWLQTTRVRKDAERERQNARTKVLLS